MNTCDGPEIGIVIVAHGMLADALLAATEHVVGNLNDAVAVAIGPNEDLRKSQARIDSAVNSVENGAGVVIFTDMFGGTPSNLSHGAMVRDDIEVIYGANLPMLVKLAKMRRKTLRDAVIAAIDAGRRYVDSAGAILETETPR